jgi:hypothetical protein
MTFQPLLVFSPTTAEKEDRSDNDLKTLKSGVRSAVVGENTNNGLGILGLVECFFSVLLSAMTADR